jgi:ribosome maturation factor RimP
LAAQDTAARIQDLIEPTINDMGFEIVRVQVSGGQTMKVQIMAEPLDGTDMTVEACAKISRAVSAVMDVEDPIADAYTLEVSSPGIDRPLVRLKDFDRFKGFEAKIELLQVVDGRRKFSGRLVGTEDENIQVDTHGETISVPFSGIAKAKLIVTDEMIAQLGKEKAS